MAANFESGITYGQKSWHEQEENRRADDIRRFSIVETIRGAKMDWRVSKHALAVATGDLAGTIAPMSYGIFRTDTWAQVGSVTQAYEVLQNEEIFAQFQPFADARQLAFESAGSLDGGRKIYVQARLCESDIDIGDNDVVRPYLLIASSHDRSISTHVGFTPQRVVCQNTLRMALGQDGYLRVRHRSGQKDSLALIMESIDLARADFAANCELYGKLKATPINHNDLRKYVRQVLDMDEVDADNSTCVKNQFEAILSKALFGKGQNADELSLWSAYNGVTEWITHNRQKNADPMKRNESNWFGSGAKLNDRALSIAMSLAT